MTIEVLTKQTCEGSWIDCISPDTWLLVIGTIIGSGLGALLAGLMSARITRLQFKNQSDKEKLDLIENFFNIYSPLQLHLNDITQNLEMINKELDKESIDLEEIEELYTESIEEAEKFLFEWDKSRVEFSIPTNLYMRLSILNEIITEFVNSAVINNEGEIIIDSLKKVSEHIEELLTYNYKELNIKDKEILKEMNEIKKRLK